MKRMPRRQQSQGERQAPKPYVCLVEGEKTEAFYLEHTLKADLKQYDIDKARCTDALGIVEQAIQEVKKFKERIKNIYVVFDREFSTEQSEGTFLDSFSQIDAKLKTHKDKIIPIFTSPSIEYVLLLHFQNTNASYYNNEDLEKALKKAVQSSKFSCPYEKNNEAFFKALTPQHIQQAFDRLKQRDTVLSINADTLLRDRACKDHMPNSNFYVLIDALTNQKT
jgi:hypothetical protein